QSRVERGIGKLVATAAFSGLGDGIGALRWTGWLWPQRDGRHELALRAPGWSRLLVDGEVLIDDDTPGHPDRADIGGLPVPRRIVSVWLRVGQGYPIVVEYVRPPEAGTLTWEQVSVGLREPRGSVAEAA